MKAFVSHCTSWLLAVGAACVFDPASSAAQELVRSVRVGVDNDFFNFWQPPRERSDDNYTHGMRFTRDAVRVPRFAKRWLCLTGTACGVTVEVGQEMYTPVMDDYWPVWGDRPYAGWLYARADVRAGRSHMYRSAGVAVGLTGTPSLAEQTQNLFHRLVPAFRRPMGWRNQLPTEAAFAVHGSQSWRGIPPGIAGRVMEVVPTVSAAVGTLRTIAGAGVRVRAGAPLRHPWLASDSTGIAPYAYVEMRGKVVARELFLDGTLFRDSVRVQHRPAVAEWERGVGVRIRRLSLEYRAVTRSREYRLGPRSHTYSGLTLGWSLH